MGGVASVCFAAAQYNIRNAVVRYPALFAPSVMSIIATSRRFCNVATCEAILSLLLAMMGFAINITMYIETYTGGPATPAVTSWLLRYAYVFSPLPQ